MTAQSDEGHTGLDRDSNERSDVNRENQEQEQGQEQEGPQGNAAEERMRELTDAAKED
ncbi:hypothetical protein ACF3NS_04235 [Arsenicicoccus cauae]|uniref:Uncharacterized protein n=1 Tax=Arsenicicoccus cauae TaxID=2663847 RepID=A0A6I3IWE0_9MICO|nr:MULTISPECIES: hypothetical protein [Arsenicicoccus]MTB71186.1 hypothetical protein [Arsenicicoccus cauae]